MFLKVFSNLNYPINDYMKNDYAWRREALFNSITSGRGDFLPVCTTNDLGFRELSMTLKMSW